MDNKKNSGDISADELLRKLKENLELDLDALELPEEPVLDGEEQSAEDIIRTRSLKKAGIEPAAKDEPIVIPEIPESATEPETANQPMLDPNASTGQFPFIIPPSSIEQEEAELETEQDPLLPEYVAPEQPSPVAFEESAAVAEAFDELSPTEEQSEEEPDALAEELELSLPADEMSDTKDIFDTAEVSGLIYDELAVALEDEEPTDEPIVPDLSEFEQAEPVSAETVAPDTAEFVMALDRDDEQDEATTAEFIRALAPEAMPEPIADEIPELEELDEVAPADELIPEPIFETVPEPTVEPEVVYDLPADISMTAEFDMAVPEPIAGLFEEALAAPVEPAKPVTKEVELPADETPISSEQIDGLMRTYLTGNEYDEVTRARAADSELVRHISEAEEFVAAIEHAKQLDAPHQPLTETEKVIKEMELESDSSDEALDEVDVNLMIAFGMEKELAERLGEDKIKNVENALDIDAENLNLSRIEKPETTELPDDMEFISQNQIKDVFKVYRRKQRSLIIRFFGAAVMTLLLFIFENIGLFGGSFAGSWLDPTVFPVVHSMISLQLCFFVLAFGWSYVAAGLKSLFTFRPTAKSAIAVAALFTVIYHVAFCFLYNGGDVVFCTFPLALGVLITIISEYMSLKRDIYSFNIVSSKRIKYFISEIPADTESLERSAFEEYIDEDSNVSRVSKAAFIDGFFHRTKESTRTVPILRAILPLPVAIAIFFFIFSTFVRQDPFLGLTSGYISLMLSTPAALLLVTAVPFYRASKIAYEQGGTIIGEDSLEDYSDVAAISFDDKDVFPSGGVKIRSIKVYNNNRIDRVIYNVASLFKHIGGPLADVYSIATKDFECSDDVEIVDISPDGIEAVISGKHIFLGRESYIQRNNFTITPDLEDTRIEQTTNTSITYLVTNDEVAAKIYTSYSIDSGFAAIAKQLYRAGMCLGIKTFDPGIDDELLGRFIDLSRYPVKIIKCRSTGDKLPTEEKADSGIVSKKSARSLLKTLSLCEKVNSSSKTGLFVAMLSVIIGFAISVFLLFQGLTSSVNGIYVALYQLFWLIPILIISHLNINR